jgi:hypothetical protein
MMNAEDTVSIDFSLESIEERDGTFFFTAKSLSDNFECEEGLKRLARASINKDLLWRHRHPIEDVHKENHIYGRIVNSEVANGYIVSTYEVYKHTADHLAFIEILKERDVLGDPLGISMHYRRYYNLKNEIIHYDVFEHSGTPFPACESCKTIKVGVKTMVKEKVLETPEDTVDKVEDPDTEILKKIEELEGMLNDKTKKLEQYKGKIESLELEMKKKSEEIENKTEETKTVEERVLELESEISFLKKKPILDKILELATIDDIQLAWLKTQKKEYLNKRYEDAKKDAESKPHTKTLDQSADENVTKTDEEFEENEGDVKVTFDNFTKYLNKNKKQKKED